MANFRTADCLLGSRMFAVRGRISSELRGCNDGFGSGQSERASEREREREREREMRNCSRKREFSRIFSITSTQGPMQS
jgi:hypothetical protein